MIIIISLERERENEKNKSITYRGKTLPRTTIDTNQLSESKFVKCNDNFMKSNFLFNLCKTVQNDVRWLQ